MKKTHALNIFEIKMELLVLLHIIHSKIDHEKNWRKQIERSYLDLSEQVLPFL